MSAPTVGIIGAGMAGLTAALRLSERGCAVTVFEAQASIGGNYGAREVDGVWHEHSYHMLLNWYHNFWAIARELGLGDHFEPRHSIKHLFPWQLRSSVEISDVGAVGTLGKNLASGLASPAQWLLYGYSLIDLLSTRLPQRARLDDVSISGFLHGLWSATEETVELNGITVAKALALPANQTSAHAYHNLISYGFREPAPMMWVLRGNSHQAFLTPFAERLRVQGCRIETGTRIEAIRLDASGRATGVHAWKENPRRRLPARDFDYLIVAVSADALARLVDGEVYRFAPDLVNVRRLAEQPMASLDVYFNRKLEGIPRDIVVLRDSRFDLTFFDDSQAWPDEPHTILNVVASDFAPLEGAPLDLVQDLLIEELGNYLRFDQADIDRGRTHLRAGTDESLFANSVGAWKSRPRTTCPIPNLFIAGAHCRSIIDVVTIEGAVVSGLMAAEAVRQRAGLDRAIEIVEPESYSRESMAVLRLLLTPSAAAAKAWVDAESAWSRYVAPVWPAGRAAGGSPTEG